MGLPNIDSLENFGEASGDATSMLKAADQLMPSKTNEEKCNKRGGGGGGIPPGECEAVYNKQPIAGGSYRRSSGGTGSVLLIITCGLCIFLTLICSCLIATLIILSNRVDAARSNHDLRRQYEYSAMSTMSRDSAIVSGKDEESRQEVVAFRLAKEIKPLNYDLYLHADLDAGTFSGRVSILINVLSTQRRIVLHQKGLRIKVERLRGRDRENDNFNLDIEESYPIDKSEVFIVKPKDELTVGLYDLTLSFEGYSTNKIVGFYSSTYKDEQNRTRVIATSKFEPTYARQAFPCFDEPGFKAEYYVKLVHPNGDCYSALSNMNVKSTTVDEPSQGLSTVTFAKSVPMSTYLACFIVSDFVAVTRKANGLDGRTFPVSVYTSRAQKEKVTFALDLGVKIIEHYINVFGIDYPLPKLDMAAVPDFVSGAQENWGLVTYREARLLYNEKTTSTANMLDIAQVVAHELAHMWFGNLVTMGWWNDLWLNEGFATFMQFKSVDAIHPDWHFMDHFLLMEVHPAFEFDSKLSSHPIVQTVNNPDEITAIFDIISYQKGASVLRMLENFVGTDVFFAGVTKYLKKFAYETAETVDLFTIIQNTADNQINVNAIMDTWTRQMGFPVVNVKKHKFTYTLTQKRFLANSKSSFNPAESEFGYKWTIPVTYITSENPTPTLVWFDKDAPSLVIKLDEPVDWIKINAQQVGYYRVNYEEPEWESLLNVLRWSHKRFTTQDRTHLLEDAFSLADAGELDYVTAMNMTLYLGSEKHFTPWHVAANKLKAIDTLLSSTDTSAKFRAYVRQLVDGSYHDVTWNIDDGEEIDTLNLRTSILGLACSVGHAECLEEVGAIFRAWINNERDVRPHPDIRALVYYYGMNHAGGETEWNKMFKLFTEEKDASEKAKLMNGLAGIRSSAVLKKYIGIAMNEDHIRSQDALICLRSISANPEGTALIWDWLRENWQLLVQRYTLNDRYLGQLTPAITKTFATKTKLDEMESFFFRYPEAGAGATYRRQALESVETNIKWLESNRAKIDRWLDSQPEPQHTS